MTKKYLSSIVLYFAFICSSFGQSLSGVVTDAETKETLVMANVLGPERMGTVTDANGNFLLELPSGQVEITVSYMGYETKKLVFDIPETGSLNVEIQLSPNNEILNTVVITAGKFEQKVEETTVSLEVIKPNLVVEKNTIALQDAFNQTPGVIVTDDQANIRSGSGWSFGAGSRVLMMVDDMPLISPDAGQIQWKFLPNEALLQMEVIKGASSALFGTSAMNGLINVRTITPKSEPRTEVMLYGGFYDSPKRQSLKWWDGTQGLGGVTFLHARKIKSTELTVSGIVSRDQGFRQGEIDHRNRLNVKTTFYPKRLKGMTWGINTSVMYTEHGDVLLWKNYDEAYLARDEDPTIGSSIDYLVDPFITYRHGRGKHTLRGRTMALNNTTSSKQSNYENFSTYYYAEYQYQHFLSNDMWITTGLVGSLGYSESEVFAGYHETQNGAAFLQVDKHFNRLSISGGFRYEAFRLDDRTFSKPVFRAGANYQVGKATFFRASYGGGYRFPSMAEVYTETFVGSSGVYPNHDLLPESGWTGEIGVKQGFQISDTWKGMLDLAGFINHFDNMTEFSVGLWGPDSLSVFDRVGFRSINVGATQIVGTEVTVTSTGKIGPVALRILGGYAFMNPISLDPHRVNATYSGASGEDVDVAYTSSSSDTTGYILKYRYRHLARFDCLVEYASFGVGFSIKYNDFMQNIDNIFVDPILGPLVSPGVKESRENNPNGDLIFDARVYYEFSPKWRVSVIIDNLTNQEFTPRPAQLGPPRKFTFQVKYTL